MEADRLEISTQKFKDICEEDFSEAARDGTCPMVLYAMCVMLRVKVKADVRCQEEYNSLVKSVTTRNKRINLPLLSARCNIKKALNIGRRGVKYRWRLLKDHARKVVDECSTNYESALHVWGEDRRWETPKGTLGLPSDATIKRVMMESRPAARPEAEKWALPLTLALGRCCPTEDAGHCLAIMVTRDGLLRSGDIVLICCEKQYVKTGIFAKLLVGTTASRPDSLVARIVHPLEFDTSFDLFVGMYDAVQVHDPPCTYYIFKHSLTWSLDRLRN